MASTDLSSEKFLDVDLRLAQDSSQGTLCHVSGVMRKCDLASVGCISPHFVAPGARTIEYKSKCPETPSDLTIFESSEAAHQRMLTGTTKSWGSRSALTKTGGRGSPCSRQESTILRPSAWAISTASVTLRPSATKPGTSGLVARKPPSSRALTRSLMATSLTSASLSWRFGMGLSAGIGLILAKTSRLAVN